jgi:hypothetical protein
MKITLTFSKGIGLTILLLGIASLLAAIIYSSSIPALIGLGLTFWGIILTYIQTEEYTKKTILDSTATTLLTTLNETLETLDYKGKATYLPPKYVNNPESAKIYIPKQETGTLPPPDTTQKLETEPSRKSTQGILITAPGAELAKLIETTLGTSFLRTELGDLQQRLPKTLIEDLEIVTAFELQILATKETEKPTEHVQTLHHEISVKFTTTIYKETCKQTTQLPAIYANIGCPLSSALAVAFAKVTGKPITIKTQQTSEDGQTNETVYLILEKQTT